MSRYTGPVCRLCRREGMKLFLKGERCVSPRCAFDRRNYPPGQHGPGRQRKVSQFGIQLREKQKLRRIYGVTERVFRRYFTRAERQPGIAGENFLRLLERRLDNVIYRAGFASSRAAARQMVAHGHVLVNGRKVDIPSYQTRPGEVIRLKEKARANPFVQEALKVAQVRHIPTWLELNAEEFQVRITGLPTRQDVDIEIDEKLVVEFYSR